MIFKHKGKKRTSMGYTKDGIPHNGTETSRAAAESLGGSASAARSRVFGYIRWCGIAGATCDEAEAVLGMIHQTCSARFNDLARMGKIQDSTLRRWTRSRRKAVVWVLVD